MNVAVESLRAGAALRITLDAPPGNVLDGGAIAALDAALRRIAAPPTRAIVIEGAGEHFSFGASVPEHVPERAPAMLRALHSLLESLLALPVATIAAVRGRCLGGGLELALACDVIVAAPGARLGLPEARLGVFAPAGTVLLGERLGARAAELLLSGRDVGGEEAARLGLADLVAPDPTAAALGWIETHLVPRSAVAGAFAVRAARAARLQRFRAEIPALERLYVEELLPTHDANEGIAAFIEKRAPRWQER